MSIFDSVPNGYVLRDAQEYALREIERNWDEYDAFVIDAPVAAGKSLLAITISNWIASKGQTTSILTPKAMLQDQYTRDYSEIPTIKGKNKYPCNRKEYKTCDEFYSVAGYYCCGGQCNYQKAVEKAEEADTAIFNFHSHLFNGMSRDMYKDVLIIDESHNLIPMLSDIYTLTLWKHKENYPDGTNTKDDIIIFLHDKAKELDNRAIGIRKQYQGHKMPNTASKILLNIVKKSSRYKMIAKGMETSKELFLLTKKKKTYRGNEYECLEVRPISLKTVPHKMWPDGTVKKLILMSATMYPEDMERLGLDRKRVFNISCSSPILKKQRPIYVESTAPMGYKDLKVSIPKIAHRINQLAAVHKGKGVVHITYGLISKFKKYLKDDRFLWHNEEDKELVYKEFVESKEPKILMACGMSEGIDLVGAEFEWQIIAKVMFPSLKDELQKYFLTNRPEIYTIETARCTIQQYGRICRTPTDYGATYILDSNFRNFYYKNYRLFPVYFQEALEWNNGKKG